MARHSQRSALTTSSTINNNNNNNNNNNSNHHHPNLGDYVWTFFLFGLVATLLNVVYGAVATLGRLHRSRFDSDPVQGELVLVSPGSSKITGLSDITKKSADESSSSSLSYWSAFNASLIEGKGPLLQLIQDAGLAKDVDASMLAQFPLWSQITELYGTEPILLGLETGQCQRFQELPNKTLHFVSTAGTFNTGTNLMSELLIANCYNPDRLRAEGGPGIRWQVQWGKHTPVDDELFRRTHRTYQDPEYLAEFTFPAVMVRDPYKWMQSMCRHDYNAIWDRDLTDPQHCPNLIDPLTGGPIPVRVEYAEFNRQHPSLVHFWNDWYRAYMNAPFPFLLVRFEDLIYYPKLVVKQVCECAGGKLNDDFQYVINSAKVGDEQHGDISQRTSYLQALMRYGTRRNRYKGFLPPDLDYADHHLDRDLMKALAYPFYSADVKDNQLDSS